ncbi:MAG: hypothetical protein JWP25_8237 [Bradyrhizobium sp.]|nr:hypothetical protein [Bradyrhizobium sp.]
MSLRIGNTVYIHGMEPFHVEPAEFDRRDPLVARVIDLLTARPGAVIRLQSASLASEAKEPRSLVRLIFWTVLEMKKRGLI